MINYIVGDATEPVVKPALIVHCCNDIGAWGKGFVMALSKKNRLPEMEYKNWYKYRWRMHLDKDPDNYFELGNVQCVYFNDDCDVCNILGQEGIYFKNGVAPIRYDALRLGLLKANRYAVDNEETIHMPRIGCGLAGGTWDKVEEIIKSTIRVDTYVYDLPKKEESK